MKTKVANGIMKTAKAGFFVWLVELFLIIITVGLYGRKQAKQLEINYETYMQDHPDLRRRMQEYITKEAGKSYMEVSKEDRYKIMRGLIKSVQPHAPENLMIPYLSNPKMVEGALNYWKAHDKARETHKYLIAELNEIS
jgi:hypothetical protein